MDFHDLLAKVDPYRAFLGVFIDEQDINGVLVHVDKSGNLTIEETYPNEDRLLNTSDDLPVCLLVSHKKIIYNFSDALITSENKETTFFSLVPGGNMADFFVDTGQNCLAVIRSTALEEIKLQHPNFFDKRFIVSTYLAPVGLVNFATYLSKEQLTPTVSLGGTAFTIEDGMVRQHEVTSSEDVRINNLHIERQSVNAFSAVFNQLSGVLGQSKESSVQLHSKRLLSKLFMPLLLLLFLAFGINAVLFYFADQENAVLLQKTNQYITNTKRVTQLEEFVSKNDRYLPKVTDARYAPYLDQLASKVPRGMALSYLELVRSESESSDHLPLNKMHIRGEVTSPQIYSRWVKTILGLYWVESVENQQYSGDSKTKGGVFEVTINISANEANS